MARSPEHPSVLWPAAPRAPGRAGVSPEPLSSAVTPEAVLLLWSCLQFVCYTFYLESPRGHHTLRMCLLSRECCLGASTNVTASSLTAAASWRLRSSPGTGSVGSNRCGVWAGSSDAPSPACGWRGCRAAGSTWRPSPSGWAGARGRLLLMQILKKASDSVSLPTAVALPSALGLLRDEIEGHVLQGELLSTVTCKRVHTDAVCVSYRIH